VLGGLVVGGGLGAIMAKRVEMTKMPELVAFMHSMIGLAAVFIAVAAVAEPYAFGITPRGSDPVRQPPRTVPGRGHRRDHLQRLGDRLRQAQREVQVPPLPGRAGGVQGQHMLNLVLGIATIVLGLGFVFAGTSAPSSSCWR
jgi:H+-translocating NAD(P) transhydrogenase subunit beta